MSGLTVLVRGELNDARKAQDKERILLLGTVLSEIKNRESVNRIAREELGTSQ